MIRYVLWRLLLFAAIIILFAISTQVPAFG
jgi:hypothetical protein